MGSVPANIYALLADAVLVVHAAYVLFVVVGQLLILCGWALGWHWTRGGVFRLLHLGAIAFVVLETWVGADCPLTLWEYRLRLLAGEAGESEGFVALWLSRLLFYNAPDWVFFAAYSCFGALVALTYWLYPPEWGRR